MFCNNVSQLIDYIAIQKFVDGEINLRDLNKQAVFFVFNNHHLGSIFDEENYRQVEKCYGYVEGLEAPYEGSEMTLLRNEITSSENCVNPKLIDKFKIIQTCFLNLFSMHWNYSFDKGEHIYTRSNEDLRWVPVAIINMIRENNDLTFKIETFSCIKFSRIKSKDIVYVEQFLKYLKKEAIQSSYPAHLLMCAKNDPQWTWKIKGITVPKDIIEVIARQFILSFMPSRLQSSKKL